MRRRARPDLPRGDAREGRHSTKSTVDVRSIDRASHTETQPLGRRVSAEDHVTDLVTECNSREATPATFLSLTHLDGDSQAGGNMFATHGTAQEVENARVILVLIAVGIVVFWRIALRILLAIIAVAVGTGALVLLQGMHR